MSGGGGGERPGVEVGWARVQQGMEAARVLQGMQPGVGSGCSRAWAYLGGNTLLTLVRPHVKLRVDGCGGQRELAARLEQAHVRRADQKRPQLSLLNKVHPCGEAVNRASERVSNSRGQRVRVCLRVPALSPLDVHYAIRYLSVSRDSGVAVELFIFAQADSVRRVRVAADGVRRVRLLWPRGRARAHSF